MWSIKGKQLCKELWRMIGQMGIEKETHSGFDNKIPRHVRIKKLSGKTQNNILLVDWRNGRIIILKKKRLY